MASFSRTISSISLFLLILAISTQIHLSFSTTDPKIETNRPFSPLKSTVDVHDLLVQNGLPAGLLPNNVKSYTLSDDGSFEIELQSDCYINFDKLFHYEKKITGKLSYGSVTDVFGIQAKQLFVWLPVTGMKANQVSRTIELFFGFLSESLAAEEFQEILPCRMRACLGERTDAM